LANCPGDHPPREWHVAAGGRFSCCERGAPPQTGHQSKDGSAMSEVIQALLKCESVSFGPEDCAKLVAGFESAVTQLGLKDRNDPATTQVAKLIIQLAKDGQRDPKRLAERAAEIVRGSS